ncbi:MAG: ABC transporter ATP-binding protein [Chitinophagaceae bacterium]|nr:ABC transporter ATP-binding protein [Chitinophagaceae bacterium]
MALLEVSAIGKREGNDFTVRDIYLIQQPLQKIAIAGASGSGKTTLLKIMAGLIQPDEGTVVLENKRVLGPGEKLIPGHPEIAYLSQHFELWNNYYVEEILSYRNELSGSEAKALYEVCRIDHLLKRKTGALSGGERQRIALAGLIARSPRLLLLDEPFSNLDLAHKSILKSIIRDIEGQLGITCTMASHDPGDILPWADQILILKNGRMVQRGTAFDIYHRPSDAYTAGLFGKFNEINDPDLKAALGLQDDKINNGHIFLRPEDFLIREKRDAAPTGKVTTVQFMGSHYDVEVLLTNSLLTVRSEEAPPAVGDTVFVSLRPQKTIPYFNS